MGWREHLRGLRATLLFAFLGVALLAVLPVILLLPSDLLLGRPHIWAALALASAAAVALALWLGARLSSSLATLTSAAERVAGGSYSQGIVVRGPAEVVRLGEAFGRMARALEGSFASLGAERDRLGAVLRNMADGILIVDADGVVTLVNPAAARTLGINSAGAVGQRLAAVVHEYEIIDLARRCLALPQARNDLAVTVERASPRRYLRAVGTRVGEGPEAQVLLVVQNLTEMRRLETVRRDFFANVSHELRTPISAIKAMVETLEDGAIEDPPAARDFLGRMHREVDGLVQLVEELLQLSRIEFGQLSLEVSPLSAEGVVQAVVARLAPLAERAGVTLATEVDPEVPDARADRERLSQVLANLLHNAIKFTPPGGRVRARVHGEGREVVFSVIDTGVGIEEDDLPRLFERFYKVDRARSSGGTGLGLAIAKHLVQVQGGRIWAESLGPGRGAAFHFTVPAAD